jgi:hypothetical protein
MSTVTTDRAGARHEYELRDEQGRPRAWLRTGWRLRSGEIRTEAGSWQVRRHRHVVEVGDPGRPLIRLGSTGSTVPGVGRDLCWATSWRPSGYRGFLTRGQASIELQLAPLGHHCVAQVTGEWPERDLLVLAGQLDLMARRRRRLAAIAAATGGTH